MAEWIKVSDRLQIPESELSWKFSRSSGPGGQSVNTSDSRVELLFDVANSPSLVPYLKKRALERLDARLNDGILSIVGHEHKSQFQNRRAAQQRFVDTMVEATAPPKPPRRATKPTRSAKAARVDEKKHRGQIKKLRRFTDE